LKNDIIFYVSRVLIQVFNILPRKLALMLAGFLGEVWYLVSNKDRQIASTQMKLALGLKEEKLRSYVRACFEMMIKNLIDAVRMQSWSKKRIGSLVEVEGLEHFESAYNQGKGVIALTGHIGNFELIAAWFAYYKGYKCSVIGRKLYDERFDHMLVAQREHFNVKNIPTDASVKTILETLRNGYALGVLLDQDSRKVRGHFVDFFGRKALTAAGPMYIARKTGSPVVPLAIYRKPDDTYLLKIMPALELEWTDDKENDIINALQKCSKALEALIKHDPVQWVWIHKRWRTRPPEEVKVSE